MAKKKDNQTPDTETPEVGEIGNDVNATDTDVSGGDNDEFARLASENAELKDRLLRAVAEAENVRRRSERDKADASAYSIAGFARDILSVSDNLRRALDAVSDEAKESDDVKSFVEGVELTERELLNSLEKHGIKKLEPKGEAFDHNLHQAMFEVEDPSQPAGTVVQVVQAGYIIRDRLLRPAMVGVAKGGPKPKKPDEEAAR